MAKKKNTRPRKTEAAPKSAPAPVTQPAPGAKRGIPGTVLVFVAGFLLAFLLAWFLFSPGEKAAPEPVATEPKVETRTLTAGDLTEFFRAVDNRDFAAMSSLGTELFQPGNVIDNSDALLEPYAVDSFPPHQVYALFTHIGSPKSYRVLLTMDGNRVASFMAEEIAIAEPNS